MVNLKLFLIFIILIFSIPFIYSVSPFTSPQTVGISVEHPIADPIKVNTDHKFHFHLFNSTDGQPIINSSNVQCIFHLYDNIGSHVVKITKVSSDDVYDWEQLVTAPNFTKAGQYAFVFQCNSTSYGGGFYSHDFQVTPNGQTLSGSSVTIYVLMLGFFILIFLLLLYGAIAIQWDNNRNSNGSIASIKWSKYSKIFCWLFAYLILIWIIYSLWGLSINYFTVDIINNLLKWTFYLLIGSLFPIIVLTTIIIIVNWLNDLKLNKVLSRGGSVR